MASTDFDLITKVDINTLIGLVKTKFGSYTPTSALKTLTAVKNNGTAISAVYNPATSALKLKAGTNMEMELDSADASMVVLKNTYTLPTASSSTLGGVKVGTTLAISSGVLNLKSIITMGSGETTKSYAKVTVDAYGRVTGGGSLAAADIPDLDWSKITSGKPTTLAGYGITDGVNAVTVTGSGNAVTTASVSGHTLTLTKDTTFVTLTGTQTISGAKTFTAMLTANGGITIPSTAALKIGGATLSWDSDAEMLKVDTGVYSTGAVSALGASGTAGGSGGMDAEALWEELRTAWDGTGTTQKLIDASHVSGLGSMMAWYTTMVGTAADTDTVINRWTEVVNFLSGISDSDQMTLAGLLATKADQATVTGQLALKADKALTLKATAGLYIGTSNNTTFTTTEATLANSTVYLRVPTATSSALGLVKPGTGLGISSGTVTLNTASSTALGGVKVGTTLSISSGVLNLAVGTHGQVWVNNNGTWEKRTPVSADEVTALWNAAWA